MSRSAQSNRRTLILGALSLSLALFILLYYWVTVPTETSFGERYVNAEIPLLFPFFAIMSFKPITLTVYLTFAGVVLLFGGIKDKLRGRNTAPYKVVLLVVAFASGYEVLWNFFAWFTMWESQGGVLDAVVNTTHQYAIIPVNFNFASKIIYLTFALSLYAILFLDRLNRENH